MRTLRHVPLFHGADQVMLVQLCSAVRRIVVTPGEVLCERGAVLTACYFLESGKLLHSFEAYRDSLECDGAKAEAGTNYEAREKTLQVPGTTMCAASVLFNVRHNAYIEALTECACLILHKEALDGVLRDFPAQRVRMCERLIADMKQQKDPRLGEVQAIDKQRKSQSAVLEKLAAATSGPATIFSTSELEIQSSLHVAAAGMFDLLLHQRDDARAALRVAEAAEQELRVQLDRALARIHAEAAAPQSGPPVA